MTKLTEIESALRRIDQAGFQRLCDTYLRRRGYEQLNPIGVAFGSEKTATGTPDTLIVRADGTYDFAEYTTQKQGLAEKFAGDLSKCFDESKTGIPPAKIHEVVICFNSKLMPKEIHELATACQSHGAVLTTVGLGFLAHELHDKYPGLAREFLGVEVDSGQLLRPDEFIHVYGKGAFATALDTPFRFRADDVDRALDTLTGADVALLSGRPGVGKTRLALECLQRYVEAHPGTEAWCVFNRGADLFHELRAHFAAPGHYILLVDDANRLSKFDYALDLLRDNRVDRTVKIIGTVRDYALEAILDKARAFGMADPIAIEPMSTEELRTLVAEVYGIVHHAYLERIAAIAEGNPRLALMAARVAHETQSLQALADVSSLYHEYFRFIREDIQELREPDALRIAGIVALLRHVDRSNAELMGLIADAFGLDVDDFWATVRKLHDLEVFDLYADEVVRISDQVLATYLFYLGVVQDKSLDLRTLFSTFFPRFRERFIEALNPVATTFDSRQVAPAVRDAVIDALTTFDERGDENAVLHLLDAFASLVPTKALNHAARMISAIEPEGERGAVSIERSNEAVRTPSALSILSHFAYAEDEDHAIAVELLVTYAKRRPGQTPLVVRVLCEQYGIHHESYLEEFKVQLRTAEVLASLTQDGTDTLAARLFVAFAGEHLRTEYNRLEPRRGLVFTHYRFVVPASNGLLTLRRLLWAQIEKLYATAELRADIDALLEAYVAHALCADAVDVIAAEVPIVLALLTRHLDPRDFGHAALVQRYLGALDDLGLSVDDVARDWLHQETVAFYGLLIDDPADRHNLDFDEARRRHAQRITAFTQKLDADELREFALHAVQLRQRIAEGYRQYQIGETATRIFRQFAEGHPLEFADILLEQLTAGNPLVLESPTLVDALIKAVGRDEAYARLADTAYPGRAAWLVMFFSLVPPAEISDGKAKELRSLYADSTVAEIPLNADYLARYAAVRPSLVLDVIETLLARTELDARVARSLWSILTAYEEIVKANPALFSQNPTLLKRVYFAACGAVPHTDHGGIVFDALLTADPAFAGEWVSWILSKRTVITSHDDTRRYEFLWRRLDATAVMRRILDAVRASGRGKILWGSYLAVFFRVTAGTTDAAELWAAQDVFLDEVISEHHADREVMGLVFGVIAGFSSERRVPRIATFLSRNTDVEAFRRLPLEPSEWSWSGSAVPMHQRRIEFFESLLPLLNRALFLPHREFVNEQIESLRDQIEREKKRDFMDE